jgi:hypothetical protein
LHGSKEVVEEVGPFLHDEAALFAGADLEGKAALRIVVDDQEGAKGELSPFFSTQQLPGVKGAVASAAHNDDVAQRDLR